MSAPRRFVCIHGHFYQPPRENPWLGAIETQASAAPFHDWNQRISAECYAPNCHAHRLDAAGNLVEMRNNYAAISFNFGPTLLSWLEHEDPHTYAGLREADEISARRFGRGNAIAQVYGHCILPLADAHDRRTQVAWGVADFVERFGRQPDGMWLPETAVDLPSLRALADHGIRFTILAPGQAARVRRVGGVWHEVKAHGVDTTCAYRCQLGDGRSIVLFFYDGALAHEVAFGGLLHDGERLAERMLHRGHGGPTQLVHIATDGESYGHHHRFGDMALAAALSALEADPSVKLTNYAAYLDQVEIEHEVEIHSHTSWSCAHGVERWRRHCGCNSGHADWQQAWRTPLRHALEWTKQQLDALFEEQASKSLHDPWGARDDYIDVVLRQTNERCERFLATHRRGGVSDHIWSLLEMQRFAMLMFTSCGWFFDDPSGLETVQILTYAARAMEIAGSLGVDLEAEFLRRLRPMRSNDPTFADGVALFDKLVRPRRIRTRL